MGTCSSLCETTVVFKQFKGADFIEGSGCNGNIGQEGFADERIWLKRTITLVFRPSRLVGMEVAK
jgi:hypothetical protein